VAASFTVDATDTGAPVRFAVHSVRRIPGGVVLDYSVTALPGDGLREGDELDSDAHLDFEALGNAPNVNLIDTAASQVYRPLADIEGRCVCTFVYAAGLTVGETEIHQAAYPSLPGGLETVTVEFGNGPLIQAVPVLAEGELPTAVNEVDLAADAEELPVAASTDDFEYPVDAPFDEPGSASRCASTSTTCSAVQVEPPWCGPSTAPARVQDSPT